MPRPQPPDASSPPDAPGASSFSWELLDHPADLRLRLRAADAPSLYRCAVEAMSAVLGAPGRSAAADATVAIRLAGSDSADLLVQLLNEVIVRLETESRLATGFTPERVTCTALEGSLELAPIGPAEETIGVKAATYGDLRFDEGEAGDITAEITLDL